MSNLEESLFQGLRKQWAAFWGIILSPSVLIVLLLTITLISLSPFDVAQNVPTGIQNILLVIISIFAGLAGALISKK